MRTTVFDQIFLLIKNLVPPPLSKTFDGVFQAFPNIRTDRFIIIMRCARIFSIYKPAFEASVYK